MNNFRADLHCHSTCSDGTLTPEEIVALAHQIGLNGLSITDHDTIQAYELALPAADKLQLPMISGVEFSTTHKNTSIHVLAYSFSVDSLLIKEFCQRHQDRRTKRNRIMLERLAKKGIFLEQRDLEEAKHSTISHTIGRPHIALAMIKKGYISSIQEAFSAFIGEGMPCYERGETVSTEETIDLIHQTNGYAVIAHPHLIKDNAIVRDLLAMKFDGLEGYYGKFYPEKHQRWVAIAQKKEWIITGGSDFHGAIKPTLPLGCSWVNGETFNILSDRFQENSKKS